MFSDISLLNGFIPLVAVQLNAIQVGDQITLIFTGHQVLGGLSSLLCMTGGNADMKTRLIFHNFVICLILLALFPACNSSPTSAAGNLAPNPSFEMGENSVVSGWEGNHQPWSEDVAHSGKHSVCIRDLPADTSTDWITSEFIPVTPGTTYTFSAYAKGDFDREAYIPELEIVWDSICNAQTGCGCCMKSASSPKSFATLLSASYSSPVKRTFSGLERY